MMIIIIPKAEEAACLIKKDERELTIGKLLKLPFTKIKEWHTADRPKDESKNDLKS